MANQRFKIPPFDRDHYELWKGRMNIYIKTSNPVYLQILVKGPFVPMKAVEASGIDGVRIDATSVPKDSSEITPPEKE